MTVDTILHIHPTTKARPCQSNLLALAVDDVEAFDAKKAHLLFSWLYGGRLTVAGRNRFGDGFVGCERCHAGQSGQM